MPTNYARDNVISLASARAHRSDPGPSSESSLRPEKQEPQHTVIVRASNFQATGEVHRQIGLDASMPLREFHQVLDIAFGTGDQSPWSFVDPAGHALDCDTALGEVLRSEGDVIVYIWGLWHIEIHCIEIYPRDNGTPRALCIGGSGGLGTDFDQAAINAELTGTETIRDVLSGARPEIVHLVDRTGVFDFIPLLQALELKRATLIDAAAVRTCRSLPRERSDEASDAFWSCILALSCLGDDALFREVIESTMAALGWVSDDGSMLSATEIQAACAASLAELSALGAYGENLSSPMERLDIYRELLRF